MLKIGSILSPSNYPRALTQRRDFLKTAAAALTFLGVDEAVYFGSHSGIFYKVTKSQGQDLWKFSENNYDGIVEGAFLQGSVLHFKTREGMFFRLDADSGRLISKVKVPEGFIPSISDGFTIAADNKTIFSSRLTRR